VATFTCEPARPHDLGHALALLRAAKLPDQGVADQFGHYMVVRNLGELVGLCGVEVHGKYGLLRSLVIDPAFRGEGAGDCLVRGILDFGRRLELRALYLFTGDTEGYFQRHGFQAMARAEAPEEVRRSWQAQTGCPESAVLMTRSL
jgi:N-acetylglutamate synthase-like GNAT family acetyltransferase